MLTFRGPEDPDVSNKLSAFARLVQWLRQVLGQQQAQEKKNENKNAVLIQKQTNSEDLVERKKSVDFAFTQQEGNKEDQSKKNTAAITADRDKQEANTKKQNKKDASAVLARPQPEMNTAPGISNPGPLKAFMLAAFKNMKRRTARRRKNITKIEEIDDWKKKSSGNDDQSSKNKKPPIPPLPKP